MLEHNIENCERLAEQVVEAWDLKTLIIYAVDMLSQTYIDEKEMFENDWNDMNEDMEA